MAMRTAANEKVARQTSLETLIPELLVVTSLGILAYVVKKTLSEREETILHHRSGDMNSMTCVEFHSTCGELKQFGTSKPCTRNFSEDRHG